MMLQYNFGSTARSTADLPHPANGAAADRIQPDPIGSENIAAAAAPTDAQPSPAGGLIAPSSLAPPTSGGLAAADGGGLTHPPSHPHGGEPEGALMGLDGFNGLMSSSASMSPSLHEEEEGMGLLATAPLSPSLFCMAPDHAVLESSLHAAGPTPTSVTAGRPEGAEAAAAHPPVQRPPVGSSPIRALDLAAPDAAGASFSPFQRQRLAADAAQAALRQLLAPEPGRNPEDVDAPLPHSASVPAPAAGGVFPHGGGGAGGGSAFGMLDFDPSVFDLPRSGRFSSGGGSALFFPSDQHRVSWDGGLFGALPAVHPHHPGASADDMRRNNQLQQLQQQKRQLLAVADDAEAMMNQRTSEMMRTHQHQHQHQHQSQQHQPAHHLQLMGMFAGGSLPGGIMQPQIGGGGGTEALDLSHYSHLGLLGGGGPALYCRSLSQAGFQQASDEGGGGGGGGGQLPPSSREFAPVIFPGAIKSGLLSADDDGGDGMEDGAGGEDRRSGSGVITRRDLEEVREGGRGGDGSMAEGPIRALIPYVFGVFPVLTLLLFQQTGAS